MKTAITLVVTARHRQAVIDYTRKKYLEQFGTIPAETNMYISAEKGNQIVGSVGLDFCDTTGKMPLEHIYRINRELLPLLLVPSNGVQIGRLIADDPIVSSLPLVYACSVYAMRLGKSCGWLNHGDAVHRVFTRKGIEFVPIPDTELIVENIPPDDRAFYTTTPDAKCYIMPLQAAANAVWPKVRELVNNHTIVFGSDFS